MATAKVTACPRATSRLRALAWQGGGPEQAQAGSTLTPSMTGGEDGMQAVEQPGLQTRHLQGSSRSQRRADFSL